MCRKLMYRQKERISKDKYFRLSFYSLLTTNNFLKIINFPKINLLHKKHRITDTK